MDVRAASTNAAPQSRPLLVIDSRTETIALAGSLLLFISLAALRAWDHPFPFYDDVAYLDAASRIHESGGLLPLVRGLFDGSWPEENRNPLYLGLLSIFASRDASFHLRARVLGIALGAVALIISCWAARCLFGARAAIWIALLLASSETLIAWSAHEACEPLLLCFCALAFERLLRDSPARTSLFLAGCYSGLAWLTKGTGIFIALAACLAILWEERKNISRALLEIGCVASGLLLGALPLLVRNLLRFRSPLHNYNDRFLWIDPLDDFSEIYAPGALARLDRGPLAYLRALTPGKALLRLGRGLGETLVHLGDSMSPVSPRPFGPVHLSWIVLGIGAAILSLRLAARWQRGFARTFFLAHAAFTFAFFAFYNAVSGSSRYLMPLALTLLFPLGRWLAEFHDRAPGRSGRGLARFVNPRGAVVLIAVAIVLSLALDPREHAPPPGFAAAFEAVRARVGPGDVFAIDARSRLQPYWALDPGVRMETISTSWEGRLLPASAIISELRARAVRWVVLDGTSRKDSEPRWFFASELPLQSDGSLPLEPLPHGLRVVWADPGSPRRFALLELSPAE